MKINRHQKIIELIQQYQIETQEELAQRLEESGIIVTQATISRDIKDLRLTKMQGNDGNQQYAILQNSGTADLGKKYKRILKDGFASMEMAQNILVIKTVSGMAMAVAAAIDAMNWPEVVGCIAGDDTIMCAIKSVVETEKVIEKIQKIIS